MTVKKTAADHARTGTTRPDRQRQLQADTALGIGPAPLYLEPAIAAIWAELAGMLPRGLCRPSDRISFEALARATALMRQGELTAAGLAQLRLLADSFGLSPKSRQALDLVYKLAEIPSGDQFEF
jgi:phage terminase small subunit